MLNTVRFIIDHPLNKHRPFTALLKFIKWQVTSRLVRYPILYPWINDSKILAWNGLTGVTGNIYCGLHEYEDMAFTLHFLRSADWFADVGANVGSYTVLAATTGAHVLAVEPLPPTFDILRKNIGVNGFPQRVEALNVGLASEEGTLFFTNNLDTVNHVVVEGTTGSQRVRVTTLDIICADHCPALVKMDVEGFEAEVIRGAAQTLQNRTLCALIVELNDAAKQYGTTDVPDLLAQYGFTRMQYEPTSRSLKPFQFSSSANGLFVRDRGFVQDRLLNSISYSIGKTNI